MVTLLFKQLFSNSKGRNNPNKKILITFLVLFLFRFGNALPLMDIDQEALRKSFNQLDNKNAIMQLINMYSGGGSNTVITPFSLGIIPFINASILVDLLTAIFPFLEKLQSEEGELGRKKLSFYKKVLTFFFSIVQSSFLIIYLKPYIYNTDLINLFFIGLELVTGAISIVWLSNIIDNKGIGNGTSLIIFTNIVVSLLTKNLFSNYNLSSTFFPECAFLLIFVLLICISQIARINIEVVSARQLAFLENIEKNDKDGKVIQQLNDIKENGLSIRLNQAGIFPIIIASNLIPFLSYFLANIFSQVKIIETICYYIIIIAFNYFYTIVFWDPEKISEQLRKASVSIVNVTPGKETVLYLEQVVKSSSIVGGIFLCFILFFYDFIKQALNSYLLNQINISSLIILVGVAYEIQKTTRALYKNVL